MALIGQIKEIKTVDGQIEAIVETGSGRAITATVMPAGNAESYPLVGDSALCQPCGQEWVISAVFSEDTQTAAGEAILFSRTSDGVIAATVLLKANGPIEIKPGAGQVAGVGNATDFVALSVPTKAALDAIEAACTAFVPPGAPDGGAALAAAISGALLGVGTDVASTNLKAD